MSNLFISYLKQFNRKERFYVVREATKGGFNLDDDFRLRLQELFMIMIPSEDVFMAMDYHLDWIYASLFLSNQPISYGKKNIFKRNPELITALQEDVDLLVAAPDQSNPDITNLIMVEAKGDTSWSNKQAESKARRLRLIFQPFSFEHILKPHYLIWSPNPSKNLRYDCFPEWALINGKIPHLKLSLDEDLTKITCCNDSGKSNINGAYWKIQTTGRGKIRKDISTECVIQNK